MVKVLAINGSPRKNGNMQIMIDAVVEGLKHAGIVVESVSLADYEIKPCDACERCYRKAWDCPIKDDAVTVLKKMAAADGLIVGSPVYFGGVTAQLKALMDRSIMPYQSALLKDKVGGALSVGGAVHGGQEITVNQIITFFLTHDMIVANSEGGIYGGMATGNDRGEVKKDDEGLKTAKGLAKRTAHLLKK